MKQRFTSLSVVAGLLVMASVAGTVFAQDATDTLPAHPRYEVLPARPATEAQDPAATPLTTWNGTFVYQSKTYKYNMVGTAPSTGTSTTVPVFIIPIALQYKGTTTTTFSPLTKVSNGKTAVANTVASPIFQDMDWIAGDGVTDLGTTQYEDAFQRGNFWGQVSKAPGYHVLLGAPKVAPVQTFVVPAADGSVANEFGVKVGLADINWFDSTVIQPLLKKFTAIKPTTLPIFMTYDVYLTSGGCCIGGYHSATGIQAYSHFTYIGKPGAFSQDVGALSHEVGEWLDDPLVVNTQGNIIDSKCAQINGSDILEVGDPEEVDADYGDFPYTFNGFTYNLQDLVYLEYFGAPNTTSVGGEMTFHNNPFGLTVCSNGG